MNKPILVIISWTLSEGEAWVRRNSDARDNYDWRVVITRDKLRGYRDVHYVLVGETRIGRQTLQEFAHDNKPYRRKLELA